MKRAVAALRGKPVLVAVGLGFLCAGTWVGLGLAFGLLAIGAAFLFLDWVS